MCATTRSGSGKSLEPEREVEQRQPVVEERAAARLDAPLAPPLLGALVMIRAGANAGELAELAAAQESGERLHVAAEAMVVGDEHLAARALPRRSRCARRRAP